jgi:periplasmic divalent cation tolerance protein
MTNFIMVFVTTPGIAEARKIAKTLIHKKIAACVNIARGIESLFFWEGKVNNEKETLLIIKTKKSKFNLLVKTVKSLHSYSVPEIIAFPIILADKKYLRWINESLG